MGFPLVLPRDTLYQGQPFGGDFPASLGWIGWLMREHPLCCRTIDIGWLYGISSQYWPRAYRSYMDHIYLSWFPRYIVRKKIYFTSSDPHHGISRRIFRHIFWDILSDILSDILCDTVPTEIWLSQLRSGSAHWDLALAVEVRQCWDLALAVEVRQCPLSSGARRWGPAVPTELWSSLRSGSHWDLELAVEAEVGVEVGRPALIKSRDPRLAEPPIYCRTYNPPNKYRPCQVGAWRITFLQNWLIFKVRLLGDGMVPYF